MATDLAPIIAAFEGLRPHTVPALMDLYHQDATFKDPFNEVQGHAAIRQVYVHMFATLKQPRFKVHEAVGDGRQAFLSWDFSFERQPSGRTLVIRGATHLRFGSDGRITMHRDYWDAAEELYARLPVIGVVMRWLRGRLSAK